MATAMVTGGSESMLCFGGIKAWEGLRVMSNNCDDFHHVEGRQLFAVKTGASPMANWSFKAWAIALNTGSWAATQIEAP